MKRITIRDIADSLGLHHSTVSRALKNDARISISTRSRTQRLAEQLGYVPDPMLSALVAYRSRNSDKRFRPTLAWITNHPTRDGWRSSNEEAYFRGASRRAAEQGYVVEEFWLREPGMNPDRASQTLANRNIHGLLLAPQPNAYARFRFPWESFSAVAVGRPLAHPVLDSAGSNHFRSFVTLMRTLECVGYRRPGLACSPRMHAWTGRAWMAAFVAHQRNPLPVFMNAPWTKLEFGKWLGEHRPDVVISHDETLLLWMEDFGLKVPGDIGFALAARQHDTSPRCSGIDENSELVGMTAIDLLVRNIHCQGKGIPAIPVSALVPGTWIKGETLRETTA